MKSFNTNRTERIQPGFICLALVLVFLAPYNTIEAQTPLGSLFQRTIPQKAKKDTADKTCRGQFCGHVFIAPAEIKISSDSVKGDSVVLVLELSNRTDTALTGVWKAYDVVPPQGIALDSTDSGHSSEKRTTSLLSNEDDVSESRRDGMALSTWLTGFPDSVTIEPHTTIKMNVIVRVPKELKEGIYTGWLGAMSEYLGHRPPPQKPILLGIISRVKITYQASKGSENNKGN